MKKRSSKALLQYQTKDFNKKVEAKPQDEEEDDAVLHSSVVPTKA